MTNAKFICIEGTEGCGKSTHTKKLTTYLKDKGFSVLETKEPGTPLSPLTMELRGIMLDAKWDGQLTVAAREFISQAIRSIHMENVIIPALTSYDYIIQDRGILSGFAYGLACGNDNLLIAQLVNEVTKKTGKSYWNLYDKVIYLKGDAAKGLSRARAAKQEFAAGDSIEAKGFSFLEKVSTNMDQIITSFPHAIINMEGRSVNANFAEILKSLELGE